MKKLERKSKRLRRLIPLPLPSPPDPEDIVSSVSEGILKILKGVQVVDEYIRKADDIIKSLDRTLSGPQTTSMISEAEKEAIKQEVVRLLDEFINTRGKEPLMKAYELAKKLPEGCEVCIKFILAAIDAYNEGLVDEAVEWAQIVRRTVRVM